jgi:uncharacterized integral membrane protein (TIGR00698 family)
MIVSKKIQYILYTIVIILCFTPFISPIVALITGILVSTFTNRNEKLSKHTALLLKLSVVLLGFGMNIETVITVSKSGFFDTAMAAIFVMTIGFFLGKLLKVDPKISTLISAGTAICGGTAIIAIAPLIDARNYQISFSLVIIFILNAAALILFPLIGQFFNMSQEAFGLWSAIAIHDTSSVVGATATYGDIALKTAIAVKLTRMLWIIPLSVFISLLGKNNITGKIKIPWFIGLFLLSSLINYLLPAWQSTFVHFEWFGKKLMIVTLFLIGLNISISEAKEAGLKSFLLALLLWIFIGCVSFILINE